jgi:putative protease
MKKIELLAPAGSFEKAKVAFEYGADAVYCGTPKLSLRSRSQLNDDDLVKTVEYAKEHGKRVHVAINIFAWDETYDEIKAQAKILNDLKVDGIIIADGGVVEAVKEAAPDCEIHISTQANTVSYHTCEFWHKNGAKRVILRARIK